MPIRREPYITRQMLRDEPSTLWVFGDNLIQCGLDGQAAEMRGEPNAVGIPTKRLPAHDPGAYFDDSDFETFRATTEGPFRRLAAHLEVGGIVVWPSDGIGAHLADMERRAPRIWESLEQAQKALEAIG